MSISAATVTVPAQLQRLSALVIAIPSSSLTPPVSPCLDRLILAVLKAGLSCLGSASTEKMKRQ